MKCDICHTREANVHLTEVVNNKVTKLNLCEECARAKGEEMQSHFGLTDLLGSLMDLGPAAVDERGHKSTSLRCSVCGMTYYDFQKIGRLGCGECYEAFKNDLSALLKKIHGSDRHAGKVPYIAGKRAVKDPELLARLKTDLEKLVQSEEFEKAAVLRDRIREIEEKGVKPRSKKEGNET